MITRKAYAKINLGLDVTGRRDDGYHIVRMIMQNVDIYDTLTFEKKISGKISLTANKDTCALQNARGLWLPASCCSFS